MPETRSRDCGARCWEHRLACITVTYHPDLRVLMRQLASLPGQSIKVVVDNGSGGSEQANLMKAISDVPNTLLLLQPTNYGLATALNTGVRTLAERMVDVSHVLFLDQDSEPLAESVLRLCEALMFLEDKGMHPGAVGPQLRDASTGLLHGFHQMSRWRWFRSYPKLNDRGLVRVASLNGSGTLMRRSVFEEMGGLDDALFIDHVDTEWSFRLISKGYSLWGVTDAVFLHRMGERGFRFWLLGWRVWPSRSPERHQFLFRNAIWLMRRSYVPLVWKVWAVIKLAITAIVHLSFDAARFAQIRAMARGVWMGLTCRPRRKK